MISHRIALCGLLLLTACGGETPEARSSAAPPADQVRKIGRYEVRNVRSDYKRDVGSTYELLDTADPTKVLARVERGTDVIYYRPGEDGHPNVMLLEFVSSRNEKLWQLWSFYDGDHRKLVEAPPPLRQVKEIMRRNGPSIWAVRAGDAEDLYLPLDADGRLAWFPEGVTGVEPVGMGGGTFWAAWIVHWGGARPGYSLSLDESLADVSGAGPTWKTVRTFQTGVYSGGTGVTALEGVAADGRCDVVPVGAANAPPPASGADCREAMANFSRARDATAAATARRIAESEKRAREAAAAKRAADAQLATANADLSKRFKELVAGKTPTDRLPLEACAIAQGLSFDAHVLLLDSRDFAHERLVGESQCLVDRAKTRAEQGEANAALWRIAGRQKAAMLHGYSAAVAAPESISTRSYVNVDDGYFARSQANEAKLKAMNEYTYGRHGVCPFERYLCP